MDKASRVSAQPDGDKEVSDVREHETVAGVITPLGCMSPDLLSDYNRYLNDWHIRHNQLLRIQDQYMPRGRTY
jgi:arginine decarboxylase-like protein